MKKSIVIDLGTNSIIFSVFSIKDNDLIIDFECCYTTRIGENLLKTNKISEKAIERNIECIQNEVSRLRQMFNIDSIKGITTEAIRKAENGQEVIKILKEKTEIHFEIITGEKEAYFTYKAVEHLTTDKQTLISDIGGGSSEFIFVQNNNIISINSVPIGAVVIEEKYKLSLNLTENIDKAKLNILNYFKDLPQKVELLVLCGGTATTIASILKKQLQYVPQEIEEMEIYPKELDIIKIAETAKIDAKRLDIIRAGITITKSLIDKVNPDQIKVSTFGARHGYIKEQINFKCIQYC